MPLPHEMVLPPPRHEDAFEAIVLDAIAQLFKRGRLTLFGRRGHAQQGIDGFDQDDPTFVFQATLQREGIYKKLLSDLEKLDKEWHPQAQTFVFALGVQRDESLQRKIVALGEERAAQGRCRVVTMFWEEISAQILARPDLVRAHFPTLAPTEPNHAAGTDRRTGRAWLVLRGDRSVSASEARVVQVFNIGQAPSYTCYFDLSLEICNVGDAAARDASVEVDLPERLLGDMSAWLGGTRHDLDDAAPLELFDPHRPVFLDRPARAGSRARLVQRVALVPASSGERLVRLALTLRATDAGDVVITLRYRIRAADGPHTAGEVEICASFSRGSKVPSQWESRRRWYRNAHPEADDLRLRVGDSTALVETRDLIELGASEFDDPDNQHLAAWRERGWLKGSRPPPWAQGGHRRYIYRNPRVPRLFVRRSGGSRPAVLTWGSAIELAAADLAMPENRQLRKYVIERLVLPAEDVPEQENDLFGPTVDTGLQPTIPVGDDLRPIRGEEQRARLIRAGKRSRTIDAGIDEYCARLEEILSWIADPNGISAATLVEVEDLFSREVSPTEVRRVLAELVRRGRVEDTGLGVDDLFAVRVVGHLPRSG